MGNVYNKYNNHLSQLEPAKKKQRLTVRRIEQRKTSFSKRVLRNIKKQMLEIRNNFLNIKGKNTNRWTLHEKNY
mgnify:CR=1 FL=1